MNWTGGKLHRQTKWGKTQQSKQKQHFANARTKLQNGDVDPASFVPTFMQSPGRKQRSTPRRDQPSLRSRQKVLEDYPSVAPIVDRLSSMTPRRTCHRQGQNHVRHGSSLGSHGKHTSGSRTDVKQITSGEKEDEPLDDQRFHHTTSNAVGKDDGKENARLRVSPNDIEAQRRRLLDRPDWLGLNRTNQLHLEFVSDRGRDPVAKRRKITRADKVRRQEEQHARHRVPSIHEELVMHGALNLGGDAFDEGSIKIRIGDAALISQTDAMSRSKAPRSRVSTLSSEPMLLDDNTVRPGIFSAQRAIATSGEVSPSAKTHSAEAHSAKASASSIASGPDHRSPVLMVSDQDDVESVDQTPPPMTPIAAAPTLLRSGSNSSGVAPTRKAVHGSVCSDTFILHGDAEEAAEHGFERIEQDRRRLVDVKTQRDTASSIAAPMTTTPTTGPSSRRRVPAGNQTNMQELGSVEREAMTDVSATMQRPIAAQKSAFGAAQKDAKKQKPDPDAAWKAFVFGNDQGPDDDSDNEVDVSMSRRARLKKPQPPPIKRKQTSADERRKARQEPSSSLLTSTTGVGPPTPVRKESLSEQGAASLSSGSAVSSSFPYDRPSSLANASTTGTVLNTGAKMSAILMDQRKRG